MEEKNLLKVSILFSLIGILIILFISEKTVSPILDISSIDKSMLDKDVKIKGFITDMRDFPGLFILTVKDGTGEITVIAYKEEEIKLERYNLVEIEGSVKEYQGKIEIDAKQIKVL